MFKWEKGAEFSGEVIEKMYELYVVQNKKYLIQDINARYSTKVSRKKDEKNNKSVVLPLMSFVMERHLKQRHTIGVFSGVGYSKFICFDVDYNDAAFAKWQTYRIANTLNDLGIQEYYISYSGKKGYHIEIFFEDLIALTDATRFYKLVLKESGISKCDKGEVEFRPTNKQGVKLPLGIHQGSGNYCGFCDIKDSLRVKNIEDSLSQLFQIKKIRNEIIQDVLKRKLDVMDSIVTKDNKPTTKSIIATEEKFAEHQDLPIYNVTEDSIIDNAIDLLTNGLQTSGTRHNSLFKMAMYLKYLGNDNTQTEQMLVDWMDKQNKAFFSSTMTECYRDISGIVRYIFANDSTIVPKNKEVSVTLDEINAIIESCPNGNSKLMAYAMLIHSKRFARKDGVFFMTFKQMTESTSLAESTVEIHMNKLEQYGVIEVVERNRKQEGTFKKRPNLYRMTLTTSTVALTEFDNSIGEDSFEVSVKSEAETAFITSEVDASGSIAVCFNHYFNKSQLRKLLSRRQYNSLAKVM